ncbi:MAG: DUF262 domain-containing protein [Erysipelothrix sp.]
MAYEIKPLKVNSFINDKTIKLPRFQRKRSWKDKDNFLLAISVFKGYPIGVTIVNIEKENGKTSKWLLDGRQRRNALELMNSNPILIYDWARPYIGFKNSSQITELEDLFWEKIDEYIERDSIDDTESLETELESNDYEQDSPLVKSTETTDFGLTLLLRLLKINHNKRSGVGNIQRFFEFSRFFSDKLPFTNSENIVDGAFLKKWIDRYITDVDDYKNIEDFENYLTQDSKMKFESDESKINFSTYLKQNWDKISEVIDIYNSLNNLISDAEIGLIEIQDITSADSQKIFNIINNSGTKLTAAEILSAKPSWNVEVKYPSSELVSLQKSLYNKISITDVNNIVRWDVAATFVNRINDQGLLFDDSLRDEKTFEKGISFGFKLLSGQFTGGITKKHIDNLSDNISMKNNKVIDELATNMTNMIKIISEHHFFKYVNSWKKPLMSLTSDAVVYNFILLMYKEYEALGFPMTASIQTKTLQKKAIILFDKSIYEYVTRVWAGSSDSRVARNLKDFSRDKTFEKVSEDRWSELILEIIDEGTVNGTQIDQAKVTPIVYHYYFLSQIKGPNELININEVDHIYPQSKFKDLSEEMNNLYLNNLINLQIIPKRENIQKGAKSLLEINDKWLIDQIEIYSGIKLDDFDKFSNISNIEKLKDLRKPYYIKAYKEKRNDILNN